MDPGDVEAAFAYGYVLADLGRVDEARPHLCRAVANAGSNVGTQREAQAILTANGLTCD
jgi:hypothetical protein